MSKLPPAPRKTEFNTIQHRQGCPHGRAITPAQLKMLHVARRQLMLDESMWRALLANEGGVSSSKDLTQDGACKLFEALGALGFTPHATKSYPQSIEQRRVRAVEALEKEAERTLGGNWRARLRGACNYCFAFYEYETCTFEQIRRLRGFIAKTHKRSGGMK